MNLKYNFGFHLPENIHYRMPQMKTNYTPQHIKSTIQLFKQTMNMIQLLT